MKLLLLKRGETEPSFLETLCADGPNRITCCSNELEAFNAHLKSEVTYDWIILEGLTPSENEKLIHRLKSQGIRTPLTLISHNGSGEASSLPNPSLVCLYERTPKGKRLLNCHLASTESTSDVASITETPEILFEFHAPCNTRRDRRHGREAANG